MQRASLRNARNFGMSGTKVFVAVVYAGTFSTLMFPALQLAFVALPTDILIVTSDA
jgi:DNA-binding transcriptional MocR family regulator